MSDLLSVVARDWHLLLPIGVVGALSWSIWLIRKVLSARYRPTVNDFRTTTSVVVPSFREDPDVLERCLDTWLAQDPTEIIIVLDVAGHRGLRPADRARRPAADGHLRSRTRASGPRWASASARRGARCWCSATPTPAGSPACWTPCRCRSSTRPSAPSAPGRTSTCRCRASGGGSPTGSSTCATTTTFRRRPRRRGGVRLRPDRGLPAQRRPARARAPRERVLPRPAVRRRRRRPADLAGARQRLQDRAPGQRPGAVDVPEQLPGLLQAAGAVEPQLLPLLPDRGVEGLAVAGAPGHQGHRAADPAHAGDDVRRGLLRRSPPGSPTAAGWPWPCR